MVNFYVGLDLGQANDYTAVSILEKVEHSYHCRHLERVRGMPYPAIVAKVSAMLHSPALEGKTALVVDQTGVGAPVVDLFRQADLKPIGVMIHGGDKVTEEGDTGEFPREILLGLCKCFFREAG